MIIMRDIIVELDLDAVCIVFQKRPADQPIGKESEISVRKEFKCSPLLVMVKRYLDIRSEVICKSPLIS